MCKVDHRNTRIRCEIYSKLAIKTPERRHLLLTVNITPCSSVSIVNLEQVNVGWGGQCCRYRSKKRVAIVFIARICIKLTNEKLKLFEFSWDTNRKELRARCQSHGCVGFKNAIWKYFTNKDVYFRFRFSRSPLFTNEATSFWQRAIPENIGLHSKSSKPMKIQG